MNRTMLGTSLVAVLAMALAGGSASAQPAAPTPPPPPEAPPAAGEPPVTPPRDVDRDDDDRDDDDDDDRDEREEREEREERHAGHHRRMMHGGRPFDPTLGLGFGYAMPTSWDTPNVTSVRFRLPSGLTLEPRVELGLSGSTSNGAAGETESDFVGVAIGTRARLPLASRGPADLVVVGGAELEFTNTDPDGDDNADKNTTFDLSWGVGLDFWVRPSVSISTTATNPLFAYSRHVQETPGEDDKTSTFSFGAVFDPQLDLMLHLFF